MTKLVFIIDMDALFKGMDIRGLYWRRIYPWIPSLLHPPDCPTFSWSVCNHVVKISLCLIT